MSIPLEFDCEFTDDPSSCEILSKVHQPFVGIVQLIVCGKSNALLILTALASENLTAFVVLCIYRVSAMYDRNTTLIAILTLLVIVIVVITLVSISGSIVPPKTS